MKARKLLVAGLLLLPLVALSVATAGVNGKWKPIHPPPGNHVASRHKPAADKNSYLFVLRGSSGILTARGGGSYELRLNGVERNSIAFADRPSRKTAVVATRAFIHNWKATFKHSPPNVALVLPGANPARDTFVFELGVPKLNATAKTLTVSARLLKSLPARLGYLQSQLDKNPPRAFGEATLFVDSGAGETDTFCAMGIVNNSTYDLTTTANSLTVNNSHEVVAVQPLLDAPTGKKTVAGSSLNTQFYVGCDATVLYQTHSPTGAWPDGDSGAVGIYVEYDYTGSNQFECASTGALSVSCSLGSNGTVAMNWLNSAIDAILNGPGAFLQSLFVGNSTALEIVATVTNRPGSQYPVCSASADHVGCPYLTD